MKRTTRSILTAAVIVLALVAGTTASLADARGEQTYVVTVTNLTRGQILSPPVVYSHAGSFKLFVPGEPAGSELAQLAEDAVSGPLMALLGVSPGVFDYDMAGGPILPGESVSVEISTRGRSRFISVLGMLVTTNDAFYYGSRGVKGGRGTQFTAAAWDAGSEGNTESCDHIPGPPCGNPMVRVTDSAEGFVHVHAGIHNEGDLASATYDWNNPTAKITVRPIGR